VTCPDVTQQVEFGLKYMLYICMFDEFFLKLCLSLMRNHYKNDIDAL